MAIFVDEDTRLVVQGLTGSEGRFHGLRNRAYGTKVVAGVTPGKGGQDVEGVPVYDTVVDAVAGHDANTAMVFVPAPFAADAIYEAIDAGVHTVITITEGVPAHEMLRIHGYARAREVRFREALCGLVLGLDPALRHPHPEPCHGEVPHPRDHIALGKHHACSLSLRRGS